MTSNTPLQMSGAETRAESLLDRIAEESAREQARAASRYKPVMSVDESLERYNAIEKFIKTAMIEGIDYGLPPGFAKDAKPFLFKPGAQKLCAFFGYVPAYELMTEIEDWMGNAYNQEPLYYYKFRCVLAKGGDRVGEGIGSCNSWESKYRYRNAERVCPACGASAIIKGKAEYGGGWLCWDKRGGCKAKFEDDDPAIADQKTEKVPNPDIADVINTCQKQAEKRAYVEATLSATGASAHFSQDEDVVKPPPAKREPAKKEPAKKEGKPPKAGNGSVAGNAAPPTSGGSGTRPVPEELKLCIDAVRNGDYSHVGTAGKFLQDECIKLGVEKAYLDRAAGLRASYPRDKPVPTAVMETFLLDLWGIMEAAAMRKGTEAPGDKEGWLPEGLFPEEVAK